MHAVQANKLNPKAALPLLGLAQMNLLQKENTNAITLLENALQLQPGWNDALMVSHFQSISIDAATSLSFLLQLKFSPIDLLHSS